ncbi:longitudinals lacking protein, isoforms A/B/D/L-like isoform X2 [Rhodnius prolixus]|uniref:longitudinals lacking protein, isoforms A/B/D/L-like isoform X2 n=1 Tax=Rhodnius prolixus TaxID=13249 RepID=UPI003D18C8D5
MIGFSALFNRACERFKCDICLRGYKYKESLLRHKRYECGKQPTIPCPYCQYKAKFKS